MSKFKRGDKVSALMEIIGEVDEDGDCLVETSDGCSMYLPENGLREVVQPVGLSNGDVVRSVEAWRGSVIPSGCMKVVDVQGNSFVGYYLNESGTRTYVEGSCSDWYKVV